MTTSSSIVLSTSAQLGGYASEVASNLKSRGDVDPTLANALITLATQAKTDLDAQGALIDTATGAMIVHLSQTVAFGDFSALLSGVKTLDYTISAVLPTNAKLFAIVSASDLTGFDDNGGSGTATLIVGTSAGGNQIATSLNVATGQTGFPKAFTAGSTGFATVSLSGALVSARFTSNHDLNTFTAGSVKIHVYYFVLA